LGNTAILMYWLVVWIKSYHSHRDVISLLVLLFVFQSFLSEIWVAMAVSFSVGGQDMRDMVLFGNYTVQSIVVLILMAIHYFVRRIE